MPFRYPRNAPVAKIQPGDHVRFPSKAGGVLHWIYGQVVKHRNNNEIRVAIQIEPGQGNHNPERLRFRDRSQLELAYGR